MIEFRPYHSDSISIPPSDKQLPDYSYKFHSTVANLSKQFRALALKHHPDKGGDPEKFKAIVVDKSFTYDDSLSLEDNLHFGRDYLEAKLYSRTDFRNALGLVKEFQLEWDGKAQFVRETEFLLKVYTILAEVQELGCEASVLAKLDELKIQLGKDICLYEEYEMALYAIADKYIAICRAIGTGKKKEAEKCNYTTKYFMYAKRMLFMRSCKSAERQLSPSKIEPLLQNIKNNLLFFS